MWGCVGRGLTVVPYWRSLYLCVWFFPVAAELCVLSSCWGWGRLLLNLFLVCLLSNLPGAPAVFCFVSGSWRPFWGSTPCCLRLADLLLRWGFRVGLGVSCYRYLVPHFGFLPCASAAPLTLLPLRGSAPLPGASACLTPFAGLLLGLCWKGVCCATWFFSHVPCSSSGPAACAAFPDAGSLGVFRSPGVCPSASLVTWIGFQPFPSFSIISCSACLQGWPGLYTLCQGAPVTVMSPWFGVRSPAPLPLP